MLGQWQPQTASDIVRRFELDIFTLIGKLPVTEVQARDVLDAFQAVELRGQPSTCERCWRHVRRATLPRSD